MTTDPTPAAVERCPHGVILPHECRECFRDLDALFNSPAYQQGFDAGMGHPSYSTGIVPPDIGSLNPFANGPARDRWEAGFRQAIN
jgi:hypothetical protein